MPTLYYVQTLLSGLELRAKRGIKLERFKLVPRPVPRYGRRARAVLDRHKERPRFLSARFVRDHMPLSDDDGTMTVGDTCLEDQYLDDLSRKVSKFLQLKKQGSLLAFGGRHWRFGRLIAKQADAKTLVYADDNQESLQEAEANEDEEILTVECDINDNDQISTLGKYDGILMKEVLERAHDLDSLFAALYKILKLAGRAIFITRLRPALPLPPRIKERWTSTAPEFGIIRTTAERHDFTCDQQILKYPVKISKSDWADVLAERSLPFTSDLKDDEIEKFIAGLEGEIVEFEDEIQLIALIKEIQD